MKFLVFLTIAALVGSSMGEQKDIDTVKEKFNQLLEQLKQIGLDSLATAAKQALDAGKASLVDLLTQLQQNGLGALGKRGLKEDAIAKAAEIYGQVKDVIENNAAKAETAFADAIDKLKVVLEKIHDSDFYKDLDNKVHEIKANVDAILKEHNIQMRSIEDDLVNEINKAANQRGKGDLGRKIADFFKPHIAKIQQHIQNLGDAAKGHATNLHETLKGHIATLADKLQPHVDKMKEHGQTLVGHGNKAVEDLKAAVTDILNETFKNMAGTIKDAIDTGKDSVNTITDHINEAARS